MHASPREDLAAGQKRDNELMLRLRGDDESALEELLQAYWPGLKRYAERLLSSADAAEDVAQQSFLQLWERRASWREGGSVSAFLYRVARNLCLSERRRLNVRARRAELFRRQDPPRTPQPDEILEGNELRVAARAALDALPGRRREVFELVRFHGLSYREVAEVMKISAQTVANQMSAALGQIREALGPQLDESAPPVARSRTIVRPVQVLTSGTGS